MLRGRPIKKNGGKPFTVAEGKPERIRREVGHHKDNQAAQNSGFGGDNAMNITPSFEEVARSEAAKD
jgi:hypothetical protein